MKKAIVGIVLVSLICLTGVWDSSEAAEIRLAVNTIRGVLFSMQEWGELGNYLSEKLGQPVKIIPIPADIFLNTVQNLSPDFILSNLGQAVYLQEKLGAIPLATLNDRDTGTRYGGVIFAKKGSGIAKGSDLKGKKIISLEKGATASHVFQVYHLHEQGIDPLKDFTDFKQTKKMENVILAVKAGLFDAGFIRTGALEAMAKEGAVKMDDFVIVDQRTDPDFPDVHSTALYPNWFFSASAKTEPELIARVKKLLLEITPEMKAAQSAGIKGFVEPLPMDDARKMMKATKIKPFDK